MSQEPKTPQPPQREDIDVQWAASGDLRQVQAAQLYAQIDTLDLREAQLEAALGRYGPSAALLEELQRVRRDLCWCYETLEDLGALDAPDADQAARTSWS